MNIRRTIIDTDPGIDDTAAIFLALASPEIQVEAITTVYGNGTVEECTRNALYLLEVAGRADIPVYQGAGKPLLRNPEYAHHVHGSNALGGIQHPPPHGHIQNTHAVKAIIDCILAYPGEVTLVALGPLTNVSLALSLEPRLSSAVKELIVMGGAILTHGNASEVASANFYSDPEAAAIVYQSGIPIVQAGLDVCIKCLVRREYLERIFQAGTPTTRFLASITPQLIRFYDEWGWSRPEGSVGYNDVPAIAYLVDRNLYRIEEYFVRISVNDELTKGQTVADVTNRLKLPPNVKVLMDVASDGLLEMFTSRLVCYVPHPFGCTINS
jgi:inosine-uridine nucleoside N-ribohydrolase